IGLDVEALARAVATVWPSITDPGDALTQAYEHAVHQRIELRGSLAVQVQTRPHLEVFASLVCWLEWSRRARALRESRTPSPLLLPREPLGALFDCHWTTIGNYVAILRDAGLIVCDDPEDYSYKTHRAQAWRFRPDCPDVMLPFALPPMPEDD